MIKRVNVLIFTFALLMLGTLVTADVPSGNPEQAINIPEPQLKAMKDIASVPLSFTKNNGQWDESVLFRADAGGAVMWFGKDKAFYQFTRQIEPPGPFHLPPDMKGEQTGEIEYLLINASFVGANPNPNMVGLDKLTHKSNYFIGDNPDEWRTDVPNYAAIMYNEIYPGIDLKYYGGNGKMEYDFIVSPGADPSLIQVRYDGAKDISVNDNGELVIETDWGTVTEHTPYVYQMNGDEKVKIEAEYSLIDNFTFGFSLSENYNSELAVVIDPVLTYCTYFGGSSHDYLTDIAVGPNKTAFITGYTYSTNIPMVNPYDNSHGGSSYYDVIIAKFDLSSSGNGSLIYSTYLGGAEYDYGDGIAVDGDGNAYVTGRTYGGLVPVNAYDAGYHGGYDVFLAKLSAAGNTMLYLTYLGGLSSDYPYGGVALVGDTAIISGYTYSDDFPKINAFDSIYNSTKGFIAKIATSIPGTGSLIYSTYWGGSSSDYIYASTVDDEGNIYVTGNTYSTDIPTTPDAFMTEPPGYYNVFVAKLSAAGDSLIYGTYYGGSVDTYPRALEVDASGCACIIGYTYAVDLPLVNGLDTLSSGLWYEKGFITKFSAAGDNILYGTYLENAADGYVSARGICLDNNGNIYGLCRTNQPGLPTTPSALQTDTAGSSDLYIVKISPFRKGASSLLFGSYLGGTGYESLTSYGAGIDSDGKGEIFFGCYSYSTDFPLSNQYSGPIGATSNYYDMIIGRLTFLSAENSRQMVDTVIFTDTLIKVAYSVPEGTGALTSAIYYRLSGANLFTQANSTGTVGDTLYFKIPDTLFTNRGIDYYISLYWTTTDQSEFIGGSTYPLTLVTQLTNAQGMRPTAMPNAQYRIIGVPIDVGGNATASSVFADDLGGGYGTQWRLGQYKKDTTIDSSYVFEYPNVDAVKPGIGYWLAARGGKKYGAAGYSVQPNRIYGGNRYYEVPLDSGWNMLANPFVFAVDWDSVTFDTGGVVVGHDATLMEDSAYSYNGSEYVTVQSIPAWEGIFVRTEVHNMKALIRYRQGLVVPKLMPEHQSSFSSNNWAINLKLISNDKVDAGNFAGVKKDASIDRDKYDFSEPPAAPEAPWLAFKLPDNSADKKRSDYRPPFNDGAEWEIVFSSDRNRVVAIDDLEQLPIRMTAWLILDNGDKIPVKAENNITLPDGVKTARLLIGTEDYLSGKGTPLVPIDYVLHQNYPNPFNPTTTIQFALSQPGPVKLEIFNTLGQRVATLVDRDMPTGYHTVKWNGVDNSGSEVASGIYLYKIQAGSFTDSKKMMLLK